MDILRLKKIRKIKGIKQHDLAIAIGVSKSTIGMYEQGRREPDHDTLLKLAEFFNVTVDYLLGRDDEKLPDKKVIIQQVVKELVNNPIMFMGENISQKDMDLLIDAISLSVDIALDKNKNR